MQSLNRSSHTPTAHLAPHVLKSYLLCMVYTVSARNTAVVMTNAFTTRSRSKYVTMVPTDTLSIRVCEASQYTCT